MYFDVLLLPSEHLDQLQTVLEALCLHQLANKFVDPTNKPVAYISGVTLVFRLNASRNISKHSKGSVFHSASILLAYSGVIS